MPNTQPPLAPCRFCGHVEPERQTAHRDALNFVEAKTETLTLTLIHCPNCFATALEEVWNGPVPAVVLRPVFIDAYIRGYETGASDTLCNPELAESDWNLFVEERTR